MPKTLAQEHCQVLDKGSPALDEQTINDLLTLIPDWQISKDRHTIHKNFTFADYYHTIAFVNAVAWIAQQENHHPDLSVTYKQCTVTYSTHSINGLSRNDFICAAKIDTLFAKS
jgi:4a-hydroxytetrahydrobiopterin dehydratase